jgi:uncharacterized membrane protein
MAAPLNRQEKALVLLLRLDAVILLTALVPAVMPFAWMQEIHRSLGIGELVASPLIGYLTRSLSLLYGLLGAVEMFASGDVRRYQPVIRFIAMLGIVFGLWIAGLDIAIGMPIYWSYSEGPTVFLIASLMFWLSGYVQDENDRR